MENSPKPQEKESPSLVPSPNSHGSQNSTSNSSTTTTTHNTNGLNHLNHRQSPPSTAVAPPPITRSEPNNPYPTTFVQADTTSFKKVVQMLTGSTETAKLAAADRPDPQKNPIPPIKTGPNKKPSSKLYERRNSMKNFKISPLIPGFVINSGSPRKPGTPEILSPSILDFPSLVLSPVTPLIPDPFNRSPPNLDVEAEDQAIAKKGFFLHPSPATTPRESEPRLLPLFPVNSPRVSGSS